MAAAAVNANTVRYISYLRKSPISIDSSLHRRLRACMHARPRLLAPYRNGCFDPELRGAIRKLSGIEPRKLSVNTTSLPASSGPITRIPRPRRRHTNDYHRSARHLRPLYSGSSVSLRWVDALACALCALRVKSGCAEAGESAAADAADAGPSKHPSL